MSVDFIKQKVGSSQLAKACRQQRQLSYFTRSEIQEEITDKYLDAWVERKFQTNDYFLNWCKNVFRTQNFLTFFKFFRQPVASSKLINDIVKPQLQRVFFAEDSYFNYTIRGKQVMQPEELDCEGFNEWALNAILFRYNDIVVVDMEDVNKPYRELVCIEDVVAIKSEKSVIKKIAYKGHIENESGEKIKGFVYMDDEAFIFYNEQYQELKNIPHDLEICPADFVANEPFGEEDAVRLSMFSFIREELEEYVFLKTLQRMAEPNGALPIVTQLQTKEKSDSNNDFKGSSPAEPMSSRQIGSQRSDEVGSEVHSSNSNLQAGTVIKVPMIRRTDGSLDMDAVTNFLNFFYIPTESLNYLNGRLKEIKDSILMSVVGELADQTNDRKNELQVKGGFVSAEDRLRRLSMTLTRLRKRTDYKMLGLAYGVGNFTNEAFYGSDFFLESQKSLYELFEKSPNPIERRTILTRLSKNRNRFNHMKSQRDILLYELLPYAADIDFDKAVEKGHVDKITFQLQTRFNYWIGMFEANYGDIVVFWNETEGLPAEKLLMISNLLSELIATDLESKKLSENEQLIELFNKVSPLLATKLVEELESEEARSLMNKKGAKKQPATTGPLN